MINGPYDLTGTTSTCGVQRKRISEIEFQARQVSRSFYQNGLRKGDVVHFVIPNNTEYHITVIGAWLCEATVSLGDPGLSLKVMETQLKDTQAKFVICFDGSRKVVYEALKNLQLLGQVQVLVLELACPMQGQDQPIIEPRFQFYKDFLRQVGDQQVPKLQNGPLQDDETFVIFWSSGTTGVPKGIQHCVKYFRKMVPDYQDRGSKSPLFATYLQNHLFTRANALFRTTVSTSDFYRDVSKWKWVCQGVLFYVFFSFCLSSERFKYEMGNKPCYLL